jgi:hypothetical protein
VGKAELARRLDCHLPQIDRLLAMTHGSQFEQLEAAFRRSVCGSWSEWSRFSRGRGVDADGQPWVGACGTRATGQRDDPVG